MSEWRRDPPATLETYMLGSRSLSQWHYVLTHDPDGRDTGDLAAPCSRYGQTARDCAWWAIAAGVIYQHAGDLEEQEELVVLDNLMMMAVNDHQDIEEAVLEWEWVIPGALLGQLPRRDG